MKRLQNGLVIFNATPHPISFWEEGWEEVEVVEPDEVINATPVEEVVERIGLAEIVTTIFEPNRDGWEIIDRAVEAGADVIVGSLAAAQAYPDVVMAMVPAPGFERVPPNQKWMRPDRFIVYFRR